MEESKVLTPTESSYMSIHCGECNEWEFIMKNKGACCWSHKGGVDDFLHMHSDCPTDTINIKFHPYGEE